MRQEVSEHLEHVVLQMDSVPAGERSLLHLLI